MTQCDLLPEYQVVYAIPKTTASGSLGREIIASRETNHRYLSGVFVFGSSSRQISGASARCLPADPHDVAWRKHVCDAEASPDIDALTETAEAVMTLLAEYGPTRLNLRGLNAAAVQGEHLATLLRATFSWRSQVPGWSEALNVAKVALMRTGIDPEEALFGLI
jgi:hypothetical protein